MYNRAYPTINLGSSDLGIASDNARQAFSKYNVHDHIRTVVPDFRYYKLNIGTPVYAYDETGNEVLANVPPATIDYITGTKLRITATATKTLLNTKLYIGEPITSNDRYCLSGVNTTEGSNIITFYQPVFTEDFQLTDGAGLAGFIKPATLKQLATYTLEGSYNYVNSPATHPHLVTLGLEQASWLLEAKFYTEAGMTIQVRSFTGQASELLGYRGTWTAYGTDTPAIANTLTTKTFVAADTTLQTNYPAGEPTSYLPKGALLALDHLAGGSGQVNYQLVFAKVLA